MRWRRRVVGLWEIIDTVELNTSIYIFLSSNFNQMKVEQKHLNSFRKIVDKYYATTKFPAKDEWKKLSNNDLWISLVGQAMVVGNSYPFEQKLLKRQDLLKQISFDNLSSKRDDEEIEATIGSVLRTCGTMWVSKDPNKVSPKTKALAENFKLLRKYPDSAIGLLQSLESQSNEEDRIIYLIKNLKFMRLKTPRDFLMGKGLNFYNIALDTRIKKVFEHLGLPLPSQYTEKTYKYYEGIIVNEICKPLDILPVKFDRILYQNADQIVATSWL